MVCKQISSMSGVEIREGLGLGTEGTLWRWDPGLGATGALKSELGSQRGEVRQRLANGAEA